jgi:hypothetical protein
MLGLGRKRLRKLLSLLSNISGFKNRLLIDSMLSHYPALE